MNNPFLSTLLAAIWFWAGLVPLSGQQQLLAFIARGPVASGGGGGGYTAHTASFNGSSDYLRTNGTPAGIADGKSFTWTDWVNFAGGDGNQQTLFAIGDGSTTRFTIYRNATTNRLGILGRSSGGTTRLDATGTTALVAADTGFDGVDGWHFIYISIDLANTSNRKVYINNVAETMTWTTYDTSTDLDLVPDTTPRYTVGADTATSPGSFFNGAHCDMTFRDSYADAVASYFSGTKPVAPPAGMDLYYSTAGSGNTWATDSSGNGFNLTPTGTLGSPTAP